MRIKRVTKIMVGLFFSSSVLTTTGIIYKVVKENNSEINAKKELVYKPTIINDSDVYKLVKYKNNSYVFDLENIEYYLVNKTLGLHPELANYNHSFKTNNVNSPKQLEYSIDTDKGINWFYSII